MAPESEFADRLPPHNHEAEQSVLGSMLKSNTVIGDVILIVHKEDFYTDAHQKIFETIVALNDKGGQPVDLIILREALQQREYLEDAGGSPYLAELWDSVPVVGQRRVLRPHRPREGAAAQPHPRRQRDPRRRLQAGHAGRRDGRRRRAADPRSRPEGRDGEPAHPRRGHRRDV